MDATITPVSNIELNVKADGYPSFTDLKANINYEYDQHLVPDSNDTYFYVTMLFRATSLDESSYILSAKNVWAFRLSPKNKITVNTLYKCTEMVAEHTQAMIDKEYKGKGIINIKMQTMEEIIDVLLDALQQCQRL